MPAGSPEVRNPPEFSEMRRMLAIEDCVLHLFRQLGRICRKPQNLGNRVRRITEWYWNRGVSNQVCAAVTQAANQGVKTMFRSVLSTAAAMLMACGSAFAGDHLYLPYPAYVAPAPVYVQPVYSVPAVAYAPSIPSYYYAPAPMFVQPVAPVAYAPVAIAPVAISPIHYYSPFVYGVRHRALRPYRSMKIEYERDGDIEVRYR